MVLKAVLERQGTSANLALNDIGKQIFWLQHLGDFNIALSYVHSKENRAHIYTRQSSGLEATLKLHIFLKICISWFYLHGI